MQHTVTQLMDLSRVDSGEVELNIEPVSLEEIIQQIWSRHESTAVERKLQVDLGAIEAAVWEVDRSLFERILDNLIENAVHYATEGGQVSLGISDDQKTLSVRNDCEGLTEEDLEKLFHRFWRKDSARSSSLHRGLGLSVASAFAQCLGMRLDPRLEDESVFEMKLSRDV